MAMKIKGFSVEPAHNSKTQNPELRTESCEREREREREMCGIALIISGTRIDLSSLLLDSVPSASSTSIDDQVGFSSFNFYCYILNSCLSKFFSFLYLENKNLI